MKKNNTKNNSLFEKIKTFCQSRNVKMTLFFGFYFFFFLFLILYFDIDEFNKSNNENQNNISENENNNDKYDASLKETWEFNTIITNNYSYEYIVMENENVISFNGQFKEENSLIEEYHYNYFLNIYNVNQIIKNSKYLDKVNEEDGYKYNYEISNKNLGSLLENDDLSNSLINNITIYTNNDLVVKKIVLELNNYMQELDRFMEYKVTLQYKETVKE